MGGGKGENRKIVITVGPLLRILVSLYVEPIDTSRNIVVWVSFNWRRGNDAVDNAIKNGDKLGGERFSPWSRWRWGWRM